MVTRIRIEAEGRSPDEVERILYTAHERFIVDGPPDLLDRLFGEPLKGQGGARPGLVDAQAGECVLERFAKDTGGEAGHGAIFWRGRMTSHFTPPQKSRDLRQRGPAHVGEGAPYVDLE